MAGRDQQKKRRQQKPRSKRRNTRDWRINPAVQEQQRSYAEFLARHCPIDTDEQMKTFEKLSEETGI